MSEVATDGGERAAPERRPDGETAAETDADDGRSYSALLRSYCQSMAASESLAFRSYAVVSALVAVLLVVTVLLALPVWIAQTIGHTALNKVGRGLLPVIVLGLLVPLFAPVVYVARNHRRDRGSKRGDAALAATGYLFVLSIYLALVISAPADLRTAPSGALAPVVELLYALPNVSSLLAPVVGALLVVLAQRYAR